MRKIKLTKGKVALVDNADYERVAKYKWSLNDGYAKATILGEFIGMHRFILGAKKGQIVDHINRNRLNNQRKNLRFCTPKESNRNRGVQGNNISGYKGVVYVRDPKSKKKWKAVLRINKKSLSLGYFHNKIDAAKCYDRYARSLFGDFAATNF